MKNMPQHKQWQGFQSIRYCSPMAQEHDESGLSPAQNTQA
jgi:hypothetical protein